MEKRSDAGTDDQEGPNVGEWRFGVYSSSSNLSNSDDKKMSDWSKRLIEMSLKTPVDNGKEAAYTSTSPQHGSPAKDRVIGFSTKKALASPKTPGELQSSTNILKDDGSQLQQSKSF